MGISKYPRAGQRIAPLTLREVLAVPTPDGLLPRREGRFENLSDLDETVWQEASASDCEVLANCVIHEVHRNLSRLPFEIRTLQLSTISPKIPLREIELQVRTYNCLKKKFGLHVPPDTRIRDLLHVAGFGAHSLVDFLVALEAFQSRPYEPEQLELPSQATELETPLPADRLPPRFQVEISHYPRPGHRLAPRVLMSFLNIPVRDRRLADTRLCDLDESVWDRFTVQICRKLANAVVNRLKVFRGSLRTVAAHIRIPMPQSKGKALVLQLEQRTANCLHAAGWFGNPAMLAQQTVADLLALPSFGEKCLVDLLSSLESHIPDAFSGDSDVTATAQRLSRMKDAETVRIDDPRFGLAIQALRTHGDTLLEVAETILSGSMCPLPPKIFARRLDELHARIQSSRRMSLEDELLDLLSFEPRIRNRELAAEHFGWNGSGGETLEAVGKRYRVTRERVRQICKRQLDTILATW